MKTRRKIALHMASGLLWIPLAMLLLDWAGANKWFMVGAFTAFGMVHDHFSPHCPTCGTNVYRFKSRWFGEGHRGFTRRCSKCGRIWAKE